MKTTYTIRRDNLEPPVENRELGLFTCTLQSPELRDWLSRRGVALPEQFEITHNSGSDDPPDLSALGLGWECTDFPPDQIPIEKVHAVTGDMGMIVPGYSQTGGDLHEIRKLSTPLTGYPNFVVVNDEIAALEHTFLNKVIGGPKSKDVYGNDVLLLDRRRDPTADLVDAAITCALRKKQPQYIKLILLVGWKGYDAGDRAHIPQVAKMYPPVLS